MAGLPIRKLPLAAFLVIAITRAHIALMPAEGSTKVTFSPDAGTEALVF